MAMLNNQMVIYYIILIVAAGGLEHELYEFPYMGNNHPNWLVTNIFQRGWNHQPDSTVICLILFVYPTLV